MVVKDFFALLTGLVILSGITYAIYKGDSTAKLISSAGTSFADAVKATRPA